MLTITQTGLPPQQLADRLLARAALLRGKPDDRMYREIATLLDTSTTANFQAHGRPVWIPRKHPYGWPILQKSLLMMRKTLSYIRANWEHTAKTHIKKIKSTEYGQYHQYGQGQALRPFVALQAAEMGAIYSILKRWLEDG
jgi:phage gpG-like protein